MYHSDETDIQYVPAPVVPSHPFATWYDLRTDSEACLGRLRQGKRFVRCAGGPVRKHNCGQ